MAGPEDSPRTDSDNDETSSGIVSPAQEGTCRLLDFGPSHYEEGVKVLLCDPHETYEANPKALFLGPKAENAELAERMILDVFRDYGYWRRNFHPEDPPVIQPRDQDHPTFKDFWALFKRELEILLGELKADVPFFSPRYIGHMTTDNCLPAVVAYIATMLYNPNNVAWEAAPVTILLEVQVGRDLARMVGFGRTPEELDRTWGHITSGGTLANIESLWVAKAVKFLPIAVRFAAEEAGLDSLRAGREAKPVAGMTAWELSNLAPGEALDLKDSFIEAYAAAHPHMAPSDAAEAAVRAIKVHDILSLGDHAFFSRLKGDDTLNTPLIAVPQTMHYSWVKAAGAIGVGSGQIDVVPIDESFRMNAQALKADLVRALHDRRPVIQVVAVAGTTEEGSVDPIRMIVETRRYMASQGLTFSLHCDAAYGGYFAACFRTPEGEFRALSDMRREYRGWPSEDVYEAFRALGSVDSITIDPHKLGYVPYAAGAVVFREGRSKELVAHEAPYALGGRGPKEPSEMNIGKYILEGSKPGAAAAAVFLCNRVLPLDRRGYGKLLGHTVHTARSLHERLLDLADKLKEDFAIYSLFPPDTNVVNYMVNPVGNDRLDEMNRFSHGLYRELSIDTKSPVQTRSFIVSHTELAYDNYNPEVISPILSEHLGIRGDYFASREEVLHRLAEGIEGYDHQVVVFRATLMNPFVLEKVVESRDYIDLFLEKLERLVFKVAEDGDGRGR